MKNGATMIQHVIAHHGNIYLHLKIFYYYEDLWADREPFSYSFIHNLILPKSRYSNVAGKFRLPEAFSRQASICSLSPGKALASLWVY